jgi:hypothetical protein
MATPHAELEKLTAPKLRDLAMEKYPNLTGVSGMKKEELVEAILAEEVRLGLRPKAEKAQAAAAMDKGQLKGVLRGLKSRRTTALEGKDRQAMKATRLQMKRMKRALRKLQAAK